MKPMDARQAGIHEDDAEFDQLVERGRALHSRAVSDAIFRAVTLFRFPKSNAAAVPLKAGS